MRGLLVLCTLGASIIAYLGKSEWAVVITSVAAALTSWSEFTDVERKTERYSRAITQLKNLHSVWKSLGEVERASVDRISALICSSEEVINNERSSWMSTANNNKGVKSSDGDGAAADDPQAAEKKGRGS